MTFRTFWPLYLEQHQNPVNRWLHFVGANLAAGFFVAAAVSGRPWPALVALPCAYTFSWIGHFGFEKNRPASFHSPLLSFAGDVKMTLLMWGRLFGVAPRVA